MHWRKVRFVVQLCIDAFYVMVVYKIVEFEAVWIVASHFIQTFYCVRNLKEIVVIVARIQCFVQLVVGDRMQCSLVDPTRVISMNHFSHKPEIWFHFVRNMTQSFHKIKVKYICCVKTNTIYIKLAHPKTNYITNIVFYGWISLI